MREQIVMIWNEVSDIPTSIKYYSGFNYNIYYINSENRNHV